jgi:hypothetical protein
MKELLDIATWHSYGEEEVGPVCVQGDGKMVCSGSRGPPPKVASKGTKRSAKGSKKGPKHHQQRVTVTTSYVGDDNGKEAHDIDEECVTAAEHDFKRQARQPVDHFEKLLYMTWPKHAYPIRHKLKECSMMKNYMTMGCQAKGKKPEGDPGGKATVPFVGGP